MPITVYPAPHGANQLISFNSISNPTELLKKACGPTAAKLKNDHALETSFGELLNEHKIYSHANGFIQGTLRAYDGHHHLFLRPDDIWINILTQFSAYVNANDEDLREMFVAHQGKKELVVEMDEDFWRKIAHYKHEGSGTLKLCGWLTAFCFWGSKGYKIRRGNADSMSVELDGTRIGCFNVTEVPNGWCSVPVKIGNNGNVTYTTMIAGSVGIKVTSSGKDLHEKPGETGPDTVSPVVGWWLFECEKEE